VIVGIDGRELQGRSTGTGRYLRSLLRHWAREGGDRLIVYFNGPALQDPVLAQAGVEERVCGGRPLRGLIWQEWALPRAVTRDRPDVFFSPAYVCPLRLRIPRVVAVHDMSFFSLPDDFSPVDALRRRLLVGASMRACARIVTISEFTRREIAWRFPDLAPRVRAIPVGADDDLPPPPARDEARRRLCLSGPLLVTVGSILNRRRIPLLLLALLRLLPRWPTLTLDIVGDNRTEPRIDLESLVERLGLSRRVRLSGFVEETSLADRYAAADVAVFLSEYEGFGLPPLEAMARGVPVVASRRPAMGEVLRDAALLVEPREVEAVAEAIARVLGEPSLRSALVRKGRELAGRHSWRAAAEATWRVLSEARGR
jgi:glycosyltransferase involved in cell wall biosynthesis